MSNANNNNKYKILVNGKTPLVMDFLSHTHSYFTSMSTSDYFYDIEEHFKIVKPDAYVTFIDGTAQEVVAKINKIKDSPSYNKVPIALVGSEELCDEISKSNPLIADLFVKRPIAADNIALKLIKYLEDRSNTVENVILVDDYGIVGKKSILVVDDDRNVLKLIKSALEDKYEITTMINGVLVEKFLSNKRADLIILDYEMPIENGMNVFKRIKANPKGANIPVCFLTGVTDSERVMEIMQLKPHGYLVKPVNIELLTSTIKNLIG